MVCSEVVLRTAADGASKTQPFKAKKLKPERRVAESREKRVLSTYSCMERVEYMANVGCQEKIITYLDYLSKPQLQVCADCEAEQQTYAGLIPVPYCALALVLAQILGNHRNIQSLPFVIVPEGCPNGFGSDIRKRIKNILLPHNS
jgi:hypothetical protein